MQLGPSLTGGMSESPVTWQEIDAWQRATDTELLPWESEAMRAMSVAFVNQRYDAKKASCPAPFSTALPEETRRKVDQQFKALVGAFGKKK